MAKVTTKKADIVYVLELTEQEASALTELLVTVNIYKGHGPTLDGIYNALVLAGAESYDFEHTIEDDSVVIRSVVS